MNISFDSHCKETFTVKIKLPKFTYNFNKNSQRTVDNLSRFFTGYLTFFLLIQLEQDAHDPFTVLADPGLNFTAFNFILFFLPSPRVECEGVFSDSLNRTQT